MNYELAKALKDAVFPKDWTEWDDHDQELLMETWDMYGKGYSPTLEELIEACGDNFFRLSHSNNNDGTQWDAEGWDIGEIYTGLTPIEAVAHLWLALNKP